MHAYIRIWCTHTVSPIALPPKAALVPGLAGQSLQSYCLKCGSVASGLAAFFAGSTNQTDFAQP